MQNIRKVTKSIRQKAKCQAFLPEITIWCHSTWKLQSPFFSPFHFCLISWLAQKLNDPKTSSNTYWSFLKTFYNGKKVSLIPPFFINNKLEPDFELKDYFFNKFFADKYPPIQKNSVIPNFIECESMKSVSLNDGNILKIIRALDVNKAHGYDDISIRMIKLCDKSIIPTISNLSSQQELHQLTNFP